MDEKACFDKLTTYSLFTIQVAASKAMNKPEEWQRCEISEEAVPNEEIVWKLDRLNKKQPSILEKKVETASSSARTNHESHTLKVDLGAGLEF